MSLQVQIKGMDKFRANLRALAANLPAQYGQALREEGVAIMDASEQICPYDPENPHDDGTPHLNETGDVIGPETEDGNQVVYLSYATPYAAYVHEMGTIMEFASGRRLVRPINWSTPGTHDKFLEEPLNERAPFIVANLAKGTNIEAAMGGYVAPSMKELREQSEARAIENRRIIAINKYGHLGGRFL